MTFQKRINALRQIIKQQKTKALILKSNEPTALWLFQEEISHATIIITNQQTFLIIKSLEHINPELLKNKIIIKKIKNTQETERVIKQIRLKNVSINYESATIKDLELLKINKTHDCSSELRELRSIKNKEEINKIRIACNHAVKCWKQIIQKLNKKQFKSEKQIKKQIEEYAFKNKLKLAFNPVIASGKNAGTPHHEPGTKLNKGFLVIDFGFDFKGYKSDMTRTIYLGNPTKKEREIYSELLKVQETMIQKTKPGTKAQKLYLETIKIMKQPELFIHGLGHGVGIEIHEYPSIKPDSPDKIRKNQMLTIEPGYYTNKYGIRIEDTILIQEKPKILTQKASKKLQIIR